jgi:hypothetical protein
MAGFVLSLLRFSHMISMSLMVLLTELLTYHAEWQWEDQEQADFHCRQGRFPGRFIFTSLSERISYFEALRRWLEKCHSITSSSNLHTLSWSRLAFGPPSFGRLRQ